MKKKNVEAEVIWNKKENMLTYGNVCAKFTFFYCSQVEFNNKIDHKCVCVNVRWYNWKILSYLQHHHHHNHLHQMWFVEAHQIYYKNMKSSEGRRGEIFGLIKELFQTHEHMKYKKFNHFPDNNTNELKEELMRRIKDTTAWLELKSLQLKSQIEIWNCTAQFHSRFKMIFEKSLAEFLSNTYVRRCS